MQKYEQCVLAPRESKEVSTSDYLAAMRKRQLVKITIVSHCRDRRRECPALQSIIQPTTQHTICKKKIIQFVQFFHF